MKENKTKKAIYILISNVIFVGLIIFDYDDLKDELSKIFNY